MLRNALCSFMASFCICMFSEGRYTIYVRNFQTHYSIDNPRDLHVNSLSYASADSVI
jgi:hypothetical protein